MLPLYKNIDLQFWKSIKTCFWNLVPTPLLALPRWWPRALFYCCSPLDNTLFLFWTLTFVAEPQWEALLTPNQYKERHILQWRLLYLYRPNMFQADPFYLTNSIVLQSVPLLFSVQFGCSLPFMSYTKTDFILFYFIFTSLGKNSCQSRQI